MEEAHELASTLESNCSSTVVAQVFVSGSYTKHDGAISPAGMRHGIDLDGPSLVTGYLLTTSDDGPSPLRGRFTLGLPKPLFAAEYSIQQLCSLEEKTSSYMRIRCIDAIGALHDVHYRVQEGRKVEIKEGDDLWHEFGPEPGVNACAKLETNIESHDLSALRGAYMNDAPSEQCRNRSLPRRKVSANFVQELLKPGDENFESGKLRRSDMPSHRPCRDVTNVRLDLRPPIGGSVMLGKLHAQCTGPCRATSMKPANGASVDCEEGGRVSAYQLGDFLYVVRDNHVSRSALPCGIELDFQVRDFMRILGHSYLEEPTK